MSTKILTVWLILLTVFVGATEFYRHKNLELRNSNKQGRIEKFAEIDQNFEIMNQNFERVDANMRSLEQYLNGPLRDELKEIKRYLHEH
jgi:hypothetical protein